MSSMLSQARPYAKAAFEFAVAANDLASWSIFLRAAASVSLDANVAALLIDPRVDQANLLQLFIDVIRSQLNQQRENFLKLLHQKNRVQLLPDIVTLFEHFRAEHEKTVEAHVHSPFELDEKQLQRLQQALEKRLQRNVAVTLEVDENLIGGVVVRADDLVIDASVKGKLNRLMQDMIS